MKKVFIISLAIITIFCFCSCTKQETAILKDNAISTFNIDNTQLGDSDLVLQLSLSTQYEPKYDIYIDKNYNCSLYKNNNLVKCISLDKSQIETVNSFINEFNSKDLQTDIAVFDFWTMAIKTNLKDNMYTYGCYSDKHLINNQINNKIEAILSIFSDKLVDTNGDNIEIIND